MTLDEGWGSEARKGGGLDWGRWGGVQGCLSGCRSNNSFQMTGLPLLTLLQ